MTKETYMTIKEVREEIEKIASNKKLNLIKKTDNCEKQKATSYDLILKKQISHHVVMTKSSVGTRRINSLVTHAYRINSVYQLLEHVNNIGKGIRVTPQKIEKSHWTPIYSGDRRNLGYSFAFKNRLSIEIFLITLIDYIDSGKISSLEDSKYITEDIKYLDLLYKKVHPTQEEISYDLQKEEVEEYIEGETRLIQSQHRSRVSGLRNDVLANADYRCQLCCRTMSEIYGKEIDGKETKTLLHAHHIVPLSQGEDARSVNPKTDLIAVCPSCHAILHINGNKEAIPRERFYELRKKIVGNLQKQENIDIMNLACDEISKKEKNKNAN